MISGNLVPVSADCSLLDRLRSETDQSHVDLERRADVMRRVQTVSGYRELLENFYGVFCPLEARLEHSAELLFWLPDFPRRMRSPALRSDLAVVGSAGAERLPLASVPGLASVPAQLGCMYVLEGSTLGGQIIARQVQFHLGYLPENGCSFFSGRGSQTGSMWKGFRGSLERYGAAHPQSVDEVSSSAIEVFRTFSAWIERIS